MANVCLRLSWLRYEENIGGFLSLCLSVLFMQINFHVGMAQRSSLTICTLR